MNRLHRRFQQLRRAEKKAFIAFITAGYPSLRQTARLAAAFDRLGVDILELGIPFSDPIADGPVIQHASHQALLKGVTMSGVLALVRRLRRQGLELPICFMSYYNPLLKYGLERFVRDAHAAGVDGVIVPDLPLEEARGFSRIARRHHLDTIMFVSPTTGRQRLREIISCARGFIYYISLTGITGSRSALPADLLRQVRHIKKMTRTPVCVGFGISRPWQVRQIRQAADGVIVGSAIVRAITRHGGSADMVERVSKFVRSLKG